MQRSADPAAAAAPPKPVTLVGSSSRIILGIVTTFVGGWINVRRPLRWPTTPGGARDAIDRLTSEIGWRSRARYRHQLH